MSDFQPLVLIATIIGLKFQVAEIIAAQRLPSKSGKLMFLADLHLDRKIS
jgi:hypothetical protein